MSEKKPNLTRLSKSNNWNPTTPNDTQRNAFPVGFFYFKYIHLRLRISGANQRPEATKKMKFEISELSEAAQQICISVTAEQLTEFAQYLLCEARKQESQTGEVYLTGERVMEMMSISKTTLWRWKKQNFLVPIRIGGNDRYKMSDIQRIINQETTAAIWKKQQRRPKPPRWNPPQR